jgi:hypothetical protein
MAREKVFSLRYPLKGFASYLGQRHGPHFGNFVNSLHEMANDMELVKDNHGLTTILINDINVVLPHVATNTFNGGSAFFAPPFEESAQGFFVSVGSTPYEPLSHYLFLAWIKVQYPNAFTDMISTTCSELFEMNSSMEKPGLKPIFLASGENKAS